MSTKSKTPSPLGLGPRKNPVKVVNRARSWTPERTERFKATMKAKSEAKKNGVVVASVPSGIIPTTAEAISLLKLNEPQIDSELKERGLKALTTERLISLLALRRLRGER